jgi:hypothetical protein
MIPIRRRLFLKAAVGGAFGGLLGCGGCNKPEPVPSEEEEDANDTGPRVGRLALLVGVTKYPSGLAGPGGKLSNLVGPANDVALLRRVLMQQFAFPARNIVTLKEEAGGDLRPTRGHIEREFKRLAREARPGDQVVILLAGHGTQQPEKDPPDPQFPEDDGLDEVFLPADVRPWDPRTKTIPNGIIDDEIRLWTSAIADRKTSVFLIADCCHSGTLLRDEESEDEILRGVPPEMLIPRAALEEARQKAARRSRQRGAAEQTPLKVGELPSIVALYATQPDERTPEAWFPGPDPRDRKMHGILTYALCEILTQSTSPLTYRELAQRLPAHYRGWDRSFRVPIPTPFAEGRDLDREVLGERRWSGRSVLTLTVDDRGPWKITGGKLHGLHAGSILAVYPPPGEGDKVLGHLRITASSTLESVVVPCAHGRLPLAKDLPDGGRIDPVVVMHDLHDLRVALGMVPAGQRTLLKEAMGDLAKDASSLVRFVDDPSKATWVVRAEDRELVLTTSKTAERGANTPRFVLRSDRLEVDLKDRLRWIARALNLLAVASSSDAPPGGGKVQVELHLEKRKGEKDPRGPRLSDVERSRVKSGQWIGFRIVNKGKTRVDVTLLYIDSNYVIQDIFPFANSGEENRILPGKSLGPAQANWVSDKTVGLEHFVLIAVEARQEQRSDFSYLATPQGRDPGDRRERQMPLGRLLDHALFRAGGTRSSEAGGGDHQIRVVSWRIVPGEGKKGDK